MVADEFEVLTGWVTLFISIVILLTTGTLVAHFVNDRLLASGILRGKKFVEKTELQIKTELQKEEVTLHKLEADIAGISRRLGRIEEALVSSSRGERAQKETQNAP
ncbi:MAG: hypothetical protein Greene041679_188 [Parcubacteria group bacterium Greene0416_79]|nr:MAG: hypothetical protein Greene041679_188 [Parcubacteria group bacterium Greene0416_79]